MAASVRFATPVLARIVATCRATVARLISSSSAMMGFVAPCATNRSTYISRALRSERAAPFSEFALPRLCRRRFTSRAWSR